MARRAHAPRTPDIDLPEPLEPISALAADGDHDGVVLAGADQSNRDLTGLRLTASRLADCDLHGARLARALLAECELDRVEGVNVPGRGRRGGHCSAPAASRSS